MTLAAWAVPEKAAEMLTTRTRALVAEAIESYGGDRIAVTVVLADGRVTVHAVSLSCRLHPVDTIDRFTAAVLRGMTRPGEAAGPSRCLCADLAVLGEGWTVRRPFLVSRHGL
ncbi:hypothetical protein [Streptomyces sp. NRRL F-525]|uniref:hypothetical protein n=1 Tax=Streptomyces sp. NRRL F-525 TaxID=1463861 RepID=UPI000527634D|nr:hypothetical protein [Streptomyces sp. NRRL F-525]